MNKEIPKFVGEKIKQFRTNNNITQQELAEHLKTTSQTISRYENGILEANQDILFSLADYFHVSIDDFFPERQQINENSFNKKQVLFDKYDKLSEDDKKFITTYIIEKDKQIDKQNNNF